ncbi:endonuclease [Flavobacterium limnophilum]|uniref:endonuclease n=1 Tax=Flavobacterium limnophilum TaxID=3003262 RepID=UPI0024831150|nr:endonuclease [Flavobacterium limnophilum]
MKQKLLILALLFSCFSFAQIPAGYYNTATGTGYTLKTQLYNIIKGHTDKGYAGLWTTYSTSDRDNQYENDNTIIDMYSEKPSGADPYNFIYSTNQCGTYSVEGDCYNREHIIPQSVFNSTAPLVSDAHFITPTDGKVNGQRSNYPHGTVATATWTSLNGSKLGSSSVSGYTGTVFEPINEFKGDIARMYFYFATRYENTVAGYPYAMFNGTSNQVFTTAFLNMLLTWNTQDPVSAREIARNNAIYARQNNRNPYIDHPEYVQAIWNPTADSQAPTAPSSLAVTATTTSSVSLSWAASTDNIGVTGYNVYMNGVLKTTVTGLTATITGLTASTTYSFYVIAKDAAGNSSVASTTVNGTTTTPTSDTQAPTAPSSLATTGTTTSTVALSWLASTDNVGVTGYNVYMNGILKTTVTGLTTTITGLTASTAYSFYVIAKDAAGNLSTASTTINATTSAAATATELLFSEYIEGLSNNKALEIANLTGAAINLSVYSIKKQTNGAGAWSTGLSLTGTLNSGSKYVIVNSLIALACYNKATANISTAAGELTFNGNDAVGLFKNGVLIDIIGTFNGGTADFAADTTLRRKATVTAPSTTFNKTTQWDVFTVDTCNNLGSRMANLAIQEYSSNSNNFRIYPNPSNGDFNIIFDDANGAHSVEIFSLLGQKVFEKKNSQTASISVTNLQKGTYLIKVTKDSKSTTKKIIIN